MSDLETQDIVFAKRKVQRLPPESFQSSLSLHTSFPQQQQEVPSIEQQEMEQNDTLLRNALKQLSLGTVNDTVEQDNIDLSTFASLTRQPGVGSPSGDMVETSVLNNLTSVSSELPPGSTESDGLMLQPMRRESKNVMSQYEGRRPLSPSPLLRGEALDLPLPDMAREDSEIKKLNQYRPATILSTSSTIATPALVTPPLITPLPPLPLPSIRSNSEYHEDKYKDPQSINKLKRPLYIPLVLRPTLANNYSDMTSSQSSLNSDISDTNRDLIRYKEFNNLNFTQSPNGSQQLNSQQSSLSSSGPLQQQNFVEKLLDSMNMSKDSRQRNQSDTSSIVSNSSLSIEQGPSRDHWKLDSVLLRCSNCGKIFTNFGKIRRKHHCRSCGDIFCTNCINHYIYLDKDANFVLIDSQQKNRKTNPTPQAITDKFLSKVCYHCFENYENLLRQNNPSIFQVKLPKKVLDDTGDDYDEFDELNEIVLDNDQIKIEILNKKKIDLINNGNLPANWNWSSF